MANPNHKTPAMVLQEFTVKNGHPSPEYDLVLSKTGTHENEFRYKVSVAGVVAMGFGRSKQVAKHDAATNALEKLAEFGLYDSKENPAHGFNAQSHRNESGSPEKPPVNHIGVLNDLCMEQKLPYPIMEEISDVGPPHCREFTYKCKVASLTTQKTANTKKQAKQLAARDMLEKIKSMCPSVIEEHAADANAITDANTDKEAIAKYNELALHLGVTPNRAVKIEDFTEGLKNVMAEKDCTFDDFEKEFRIRDLDSLKQILSTLGVEYKIFVLQNNPPIAGALFGLETPFTALALGKNEDEAKVTLIKDIFRLLEGYMGP